MCQLNSINSAANPIYASPSSYTFAKANDIRLDVHALEYNLVTDTGLLVMF